MFESSRTPREAARERRNAAYESVEQISRVDAANDAFSPGWPFEQRNAAVWQQAVRNEDAASPLALGADALAILLASITTGTAYHFFIRESIGPVSDFVATGLVAALLFCSVTRWKTASPPLAPSLPVERAREALSSWITAFLLLLLIVFALKTSATLSRGAILSFFVVGMVVVVLTRMNIPFVIARARKAGTAATRGVALIGRRGDPQVALLTDALLTETGSAPPVVTFDPMDGPESWREEKRRVLDHVRALAHGAGPGEILVAAAGVSRHRLESLLDGLNVLPRTILVVPDDLTSNYLRRNAIAIGERVAVVVQKEPLNALQRALKRTLDLLGAGMALLVASPLLIAIAIAIRLDSEGPVLFRQTRNGLGGRPFKILKFRTMTVLEDGEDLAQATRDDARITPLGRFLRRASLDELPQLINVLRGEMSLVGPRPHARAHDDLYGGLIENYSLRQHVKPGISGWAQVNGLRGETPTLDTMYRRIEFDLWYATHASLLLDFVILARTLVEVFRQRNAY
jgi:Undecaprenyl-phosphate glucose phosphotransferase